MTDDIAKHPFLAGSMEPEVVWDASRRICRTLTETWREATIRYAWDYGQEEEAAAIYDSNIVGGYSDEDAAWQAIFEVGALPKVEE